jgi:hypothetical protein
VRVELLASGRGWVDLHPVVFGSDGHGRQADIGGGHFDCPPDGFAEGMIGGRSVRYVSLEQQRRFHQGYEPLTPTCTISPFCLAFLRRLPYCLDAESFGLSAIRNARSSPHCRRGFRDANWQFACSAFRTASV